MPTHKVKAGECISSIATQYGFLWETLWNHPDNATLKSERGSADVLQPGDLVVIPEKSSKKVAAATEQRHQFKLKGTPAMLRLCLQCDGKPRANEDYTLNIDGRFISGKLDGQGKLEVAIPPKASSAQLRVGPKRDLYVLNLGHIDPIDQIAGVQQRLANLGFGCKVNGSLDAATEAALRSFQEKQGLSVTGQIDDATKQKLQAAYGA